MAYLSDSLSKVTLEIPAKVTVSSHGFLLHDSCYAGGPGAWQCGKDDWNNFSMSTYMAGGGPDARAYSGGMRCKSGGTACYKSSCPGGQDYYWYMADLHYSTEYLWDEAMEALQLGFDPALYDIFSVDAPDFELVEGDVKIHYGNPNQVAKVTVIKGEGDNITVSEEDLSTRSYFNRIIVDMYTGKLDVRSIFVQGEKTGSTIPSEWCGGNPLIVAQTGAYDHRIILPAPLVVTIYLAPKTESFDFTWQDVTDKPPDEKPEDDEKTDPEEENTDEEPEPTDEGNNEMEISDWGGGGGGSGGSTGTTVNPPIDFDYMYIPESIPVNDMDGVVVGPNIVAGHDTGYGLDSESIWIKEITQSIKNSDTMTFIEHVKYHEAGLFNIGDKVFGLVYGNTRFRGWIKSKQRVITESEQYLQYEAVGVKGWLQTLPFAANYKATAHSIYWIFNDISQYLPRALVNERINLASLPTGVLPTFQLEAASFGYALDAIIDYARKYQWYIDHSGVLRIFNMDNLPVVQLSMPTEGATLTASHRIISKNLNVDVNDCRTRCIIRGDLPIQEFDELKGVTWDNTVGGYWGLGTIQLNKRIQANLITNSSIPVYVYYYEGTTPIGVSVTYVDCNTGEIKIYAPRKDSYYVRYCVKDELNPLKYDTGWRGTAFTDYGVQQVLIQHDTRFRKIIIPEGTIRDDTQYFNAYATNLLAPLQDWKIGGSVLVDGLATDLYIGKSVEILNSGCAELASKYLAITSITWNFEDNTTALNLTNDYYLGTGVIDPIDDSKYDERKMIEKVVLTKKRQEEAPWIFNT